MNAILNSIRRFALDLARDDSGVSVIEFALALPMMSVAFLGIIDYGLTSRNQMEIQESSQSAIQYAAVHGWNESAIRQAAMDATDLDVEVSAVSYCGCVEGQALIQEMCNVYCFNNELAGRYVEVTTNYQHRLMFPGAWTTADQSGNIGLSSRAITRVQ